MNEKLSHPKTSLLLLQRLGERLRLLRVRRGLSAKEMAASTGMSVVTLRSLERGGNGVAIGSYLAVMTVLGIERDLEELAAAAFLTDPDDPPAPVRYQPEPRDGERAKEAAMTPDTESTGGDPSSAPVPPPSTDHHTNAPMVASPPGELAGGLEIAGQGSFDWLDAPARDLQRLFRQVDSGTALAAGGSAPEQPSANRSSGMIDDLLN